MDLSENRKSQMQPNTMQKVHVLWVPIKKNLLEITCKGCDMQWSEEQK